MTSEREGFIPLRAAPSIVTRAWVSLPRFGLCDEPRAALSFPARCRPHVRGRRDQTKAQHSPDLAGDAVGASCAGARVPVSQSQLLPPSAGFADTENVLDFNGSYPDSARYEPRAKRACFSSILGHLRRLGAANLAREGSVLKEMLKRHSAEEIGLALDGLERIFPGQPISLRMIHGKAMIGGYRGFQSAVNAAIKAQEHRGERDTTWITRESGTAPSV